MLPGFNVTPVFAVYSLMLISIEKGISEMHWDIDRVIRLFFSLKYDLLYRPGLDGISACFCSSTLNLFPSLNAKKYTSRR